MFPTKKWFVITDKGMVFEYPNKDTAVEFGRQAITSGQFATVAVYQGDLRKTFNSTVSVTSEDFN